MVKLSSYTLDYDDIYKIIDKYRHGEEWTKEDKADLIKILSAIEGEAFPRRSDYEEHQKRQAIITKLDRTKNYDALIEQINESSKFESKWY